jgi:hypothetical protein
MQFAAHGAAVVVCDIDAEAANGIVASIQVRLMAGVDFSSLSGCLVKLVRVVTKQVPPKNKVFN